MRGWLYITLLLVASLPLAAQPSFPLTPIRSREGRYDLFAADAIGQLYVLTSSGQLKKFGPAGDSIGVFNEVRQYGRLHRLDVTNPMKPLLYYGDFGTVVILDRFLRRVQSIDLRKLGIFQPLAIARSYDNQVWVYNGQDTRLRKLSEEGQVLLSTPELRTVMDDPPMPQQVFDRNGRVYLYDVDRGLFVFDYYGAFQQRLELTGWRYPDIVEGRLMGLKDGKVMLYSLKPPGYAEVPLPATLTTAGPWYFSPQGMYVQDSSAIRLYPHWRP